MEAIGRIHQPIVWSVAGSCGPGGSFGCIRPPLVTKVTQVPGDVCGLAHRGLACRSWVTMIAVGLLVSMQQHIRLTRSDIARHRAAASFALICFLAVVLATELAVAGG